MTAAGYCIAFALCLGGESSGSAPAAITIATAAGETAIPVFNHKRHPALSTSDLSDVLPVTAVVDVDGWATVSFARIPFRFLLGAPVMELNGALVNLTGGAYQMGDTLFVPLEWLTEYVPGRFREGYRWDPVATRFEETGVTPVLFTESPTVTLRRARSNGVRDTPNAVGLRMEHTVVVDPGHGGRDPGNLGLYLPRGVNEKHVTLGIGLALARELNERGIAVVMTRRTDRSLTAGANGAEELSARSRMCVESCSLFVSIHVDAMPRGRGYQNVSGIHTYVWGGSSSANARRVAAMENDALEFEVEGGDDALEFIMRDLQVNEHNRESTILANYVQNAGAAVHPGANRGVDQANFHVLRNANRPAVLIEAGFATNRNDARFLDSVTGQRRLADAIANGIVEYLREYESKLLSSSQ